MGSPADLPETGTSIANLSLDGMANGGHGGTKAFTLSVDLRRRLDAFSLRVWNEACKKSYLATQTSPLASTQQADAKPAGSRVCTKSAQMHPGARLRDSTR